MRCSLSSPCSPCGTSSTGPKRNRFVEVPFIKYAFACCAGARQRKEGESSSSRGQPPYVAGSAQLIEEAQFLESLVLRELRAGTHAQALAGMWWLQRRVYISICRTFVSSRGCNLQKTIYTDFFRNAAKNDPQEVQCACFECS